MQYLGRVPSQLLKYSVQQTQQQYRQVYEYNIVSHVILVSIVVGVSKGSKLSQACTLTHNNTLTSLPSTHVTTILVEQETPHIRYYSINHQRGCAQRCDAPLCHELPPRSTAESALVKVSRNEGNKNILARDKKQSPIKVDFGGASWTSISRGFHSSPAMIFGWSFHLVPSKLSSTQPRNAAPRLRCYLSLTAETQQQSYNSGYDPHIQTLS